MSSVVTIAYAGAPARTVGTAFGMDVTAEVPIAGLSPAMAWPGAPRVAIELGSPEAPGGRPIEPGAELLRREAPDGTVYASVHHHPAAGYRIYFAGCGTYCIAADGSSIVCHPSAGLAAWQWQQFVFAQALPFAAVLHGFEPLHSSAVEIDGKVVAFVGGSGAGKSSVALELASRGADFFTDDVLVLSSNGATPICHRGPHVANVRDKRLRHRAEAGKAPFVWILGYDADSVRALIAPGPGSGPLGTVYFLERGRRYERVTFEAAAEPALLLGHTFNAVIRTPDRLARQLDMCARLSRFAAAYRIKAPDRLPAAELAVAIEAHALGSASAG